MKIFCQAEKNYCGRICFYSAIERSEGRWILPSLV